ncbi:MAG: DegV family protein [Anaerolineales bacterium]|nr:DegV family protein [Anaerolineales bacterium]MCK5635283.1 DegV family protein [Anaerolineales bacterium]
MSKIAIITDSTAYLPQYLVDQYDIKVAASYSIWDGGKEMYRDGLEMLPSEFYARLKKSTDIPSTSQATVTDFDEIYRPLVAEGKSIVGIHVSPKLSGTMQSATLAKENFPDAKIELVNSMSTSMELGFHVLAAARAVEAGKSFEEVVEIARDAKNQSGIFFVVDTLEYLHRNGRIGGASKLLGTALSLKPLLHVEGGQVEAFEKVRSKTKAKARLLDVVGEKIEGKQNVRLACLHAATEEEATKLLKEAEERFNPIEVIMAEVSPAVGANVGPGTVGIAYSTD